ncbi:MAG: glycoside hydrolase family 29, partial [Bacteroidia bacterium]|nr:glycoside hydrolase family 29 [Bacteroidia bacterium]
MKIKFLILLLLISTVSGISQVQLPLPTPTQQTWQNAELTVLISYDLHISDGKDYNQAKNRITPIADYNIFNPEKLDTDQWIEAVVGMGAKIAIL